MAIQDIHAEGNGRDIDLLATMIGLALGIAGLAIWLVPGQGAAFDLMRLGVSLTLVMAGIAAALLPKGHRLPELRIDQRRQVIQIVRPLGKGQAQVLQSIGFDQVGALEVTETEICVSDRQGNEMTRVPIGGPHARLDALAKLRSHPPFTQ